MNQEVVLKIPGISCEGCTTTIKRRLKATPGIIATQVDANTKLASLTFDDSEVTLDLIRETLSKIGFDPE